MQFLDFCEEVAHLPHSSSRMGPELEPNLSIVQIAYEDAVPNRGAAVHRQMWPLATNLPDTTRGSSGFLKTLFLLDFLFFISNHPSAT
jgi:hypothetical protein